MNARQPWGARLAMFALAASALAAGPASADRPLGVEVWTDRGDDAVYQPADRLEVKARASDDSYLLVYEIDAEGSVHLLYPYRGNRGLVEGRRTYLVPPENSQVDLVVQPSTGQCFIVAIASREPFRDLPWYLRPYDMQAQDVGYEGKPDEEDGITEEGRIVGDPYVAMERVRRRVLAQPDDADEFTSAYTTYYVHEQVRYPRYLCYDCHRPGYWAWWNGFDPYYTTCSVFNFRVNWGWAWGPGYWFGSVPYYYYVYRDDCPPRFRHFSLSHTCYSAWDGWRRWCSTWGGPLVRHKSSPPLGYVPPDRYKERGSGAPPGLIGSNVSKGRNGLRPAMPIGHDRLPRNEDSGRGGVIRRGGEVWRPAPGQRPGREVTPRPRDEGDGTRGVPREYRPRPAERPREEGQGRGRPERPGWQSPPAREPREERPQRERPPSEPPRGERSRDDAPRNDSPPARPHSEPGSDGGVRHGEWRGRGR